LSKNEPHVFIKKNKCTAKLSLVAKTIVGDAKCGAEVTALFASPKSNRCIIIAVMDDEIDIEIFILEVEIRPEIWDLQEATYANRDKKALRDEENTAISCCV